MPAKTWQMRHMLASHLESSRWSLLVLRWGPHAGRCCLGSLIATAICSFCHGCLFRSRGKKTKPQHKTQKPDLILTNQRSFSHFHLLPASSACTSPPRPTPSLFSLSMPLSLSLRPLPILSLSRCLSLSLSSSLEESVELAVVTRLMDDSESGMGVGEDSEARPPRSPQSLYGHARRCQTHTNLRSPTKAASHNVRMCVCRAVKGARFLLVKGSGNFSVLPRPDNDTHMLFASVQLAT